MTDQTSAVARKVHERREALGLSVRQAAQVAGVTRATWAAVEAGSRDHVRLRTLDAIDRALRLTPGTLASLAGTMVHDSPAGDRRITVVLEAKSGDTAELNAREQLLHYATTLSNYDVQRVLTYIDRLPPPPEIDEYVREAVQRAVTSLLAEGSLRDQLPRANPSSHQAKRRKVS
jgi:transcriptional regulator with XRE-family HTH domain